MILKMVTPTNHIIWSRIYIARGPWQLGDFRYIFLPNIGEDQKKSHHLSAGPLNAAIVIALRS